MVGCKSVLGFAALVATAVDAYVPLSRHSLVPPFDAFTEHTGARHIEHWDYGGAVIAKENFIRLTPDKQSKEGYLQNTEPISQREWGIQFKFRISGAAKNLYGDGLGLWFTKKDSSHPRFEVGRVLGHTDQFVGFGILFDTFRNIEAGHVHKDISIIGSNGEEPVSLDSDREGCESHYRFHEGKESFSVTDESRARIWLESGTISLEVDKYGKDKWERCFTKNLADYNLPADWMDSYFMALSATTGALSDNHDVLELKMAEPDKFHHIIRMDEEEKDAPSVQIDIHNKLKAEEVGEHVNDLAFEVSDIDKAVKKLQHKVEHDIEKVKMGLEKMLTKLEERENGSEKRIDELEEARQSTLESKLMERVQELEKVMESKLDVKLSHVAEGAHSRITSLEASNGGWWWIFFLVGILVLGYMAYTARSLNKLHRRDKLI
mmetsp:Transcript_19896/g.32731  ORF Transcript_19896/g.32731 Transcript_19896/m.32731 type:complete len:435 (+) Transcript_19896:145-1449(+)|eukprot:CAMPEP_0203754882 /NCGR_PEP_ID=MMETSP0098-20131031/8432_1 /ASSEMBLY_ACC=CAM_ASM_000208 /TAXON_ID=96639 /ORGANISM=" , Strain NY0313808BC1" /LENGTH=434 /DNA_ID=CAMNT_0050646115 /DNA_START=123 /DNA_END=1424 /DNA_ORIENTATION=-